MRILVLSDLHLEHGLLAVPPVQCDVVVLAGDIWVGDHGIKWAERTFPDSKVIVVAGNHEFYGRQYDATIAELRSAAARTSNVVYLERDEIVIDGIRFLGCILWTDFSLFGPMNIHFAMQYAVEWLTDYSAIFIRDESTGKPRRLRAQDTAKKHRESVRWLQAALRRPCVHKTVVVTHHAPHWASVPDQFVRDEGSPSYAAHLEHLMGPGTDLWIHGHMHQSCAYEERGTRVVCNPLGYAPHEINPNFRPDLVVEV